MLYNWGFGSTGSCISLCRCSASTDRHMVPLCNSPKTFCREEIFVFLPSPEALVPRKHKWIVFISLYLSLQPNTWLSRGAKHFQSPLRQPFTHPLPHAVIYSRTAPRRGAGSGGLAFHGGNYQHLHPLAFHPGEQMQSCSNPTCTAL